MLFTRSGVWVNTKSPSWDAANNLITPVTPASTDAHLNDQPTWIALPDSGSFGWLDPRLNATASSTYETDAQQEWTITLIRADGKTDRISGILTFRPFEQAPTKY